MVLKVGVYRARLFTQLEPLGVFTIWYNRQPGWRGGGMVTQKSAKLFKPVRFRSVPPSARMAELVDARDLKSLDQKSCGFDSRSAHQLKYDSGESYFSW